MKTLHSIEELEQTIALLEIEHQAKGMALKKQFTAAYKSLSPIDLIKEAFKKGEDDTPSMLEHAIVNGLSLASGYVTRRIVVGSSAGFMRRVLGSLLQFGATTAVSKNADVIHSIGQFLMKMYVSKEEKSKSVK
jgi:hypothetical protein